MQLFVRCGDPVGTLAIEVTGDETVRDLREKISSRAACFSTSHLVSPTPASSCLGAWIYNK